MNNSVNDLISCTNSYLQNRRSILPHHWCYIVTDLLILWSSAIGNEQNIDELEMRKYSGNSVCCWIAKIEDDSKHCANAETNYSIEFLFLYIAIELFSMETIGAHLNKYPEMEIKSNHINRDLFFLESLKWKSMSSNRFKSNDFD